MGRAQYGFLEELEDLKQEALIPGRIRQPVSITLSSQEMKSEITNQKIKLTSIFGEYYNLQYS